MNPASKKISKAERDAELLRTRLAKLASPETAIAKIRALQLTFPEHERGLLCEGEMLRLYDAACRGVNGEIEEANSMKFKSLRLTGNALPIDQSPCEVSLGTAADPSGVYDSREQKTVVSVCQSEPEFLSPESYTIQPSKESFSDEVQVIRTPTPEPAHNEISQQSHCSPWQEVTEDSGMSPDNICTIPSSQPNSPRTTTYEEGCDTQNICNSPSVYIISPPLVSHISHRSAEKDSVPDSESESIYDSDVDVDYILSSSPRQIYPYKPGKSIFSSSSSPLYSGTLNDRTISQSTRGVSTSVDVRSRAVSLAESTDWDVNANGLDAMAPATPTKSRKKKQKSSDVPEISEEEASLLDLPASKLRAKLNEWGLKAPRKKSEMVSMILHYQTKIIDNRNIDDDYLQSDVEREKQPAMSSEEIRAGIMKRITIHVRTSQEARKWWMKILQYEPIIVEDFAAYLMQAELVPTGNSRRREDEVDANVMAIVREWCDMQSVCTTSNPAPRQASQRKKRGRN